MDFSTLPTTSDFEAQYNTESGRKRVGQILNQRPVHQTTFDKWRRETYLNDGWLTEEEVWMLAIYARYMKLYRNAAKAREKANKLINEVRAKAQETSEYERQAA